LSVAFAPVALTPTTLVLVYDGMRRMRRMAGTAWRTTVVSAGCRSLA